MSGTWLNISFKELSYSIGNGINPYDFPDEEFELYSVPSHDADKPEIVTGKQIRSNKQIVSEGMILLCKINPRINRTWIVKKASGRRQIASTEWIVFRKSDFIQPTYLMYFMRQGDFRDFLAANASGVGGSLMRVKTVTLSGFIFRMPGLLTQSKIVAKLEELLSDLDAGVEELKAAQKKLAQYRQSLLKAAVEGALTAEWRKHNKPEETGGQLLQRILKERRARWEAKQLAKFKEQGKTHPKDWQAKYPKPVQPDVTNLPELPEGWVWSTVDQCALDETALTDGPFGSNLKSSHYQDHGPRVIRLQNIGDGIFVDAKAHISDAHYSELVKHAVEENDLVMAMLGEALPRCCIIPNAIPPAIVKADCARIRVNCELIKPGLLNFQLISKPTKERVKKLIKGIGRPRINLTSMRTIPIVICAMEEQEEIDKILSEALYSIDTQSKAIDLSFKQSSAQRKNILKAAFSGQLVPQDPTDEPASVLLERIRAEREQEKNAVKRQGRRNGT